MPRSHRRFHSTFLPLNKNVALYTMTPSQTSSVACRCIDISHFCSPLLLSLLFFNVLFLFLLVLLCFIFLSWKNQKRVAGMTSETECRLCCTCMFLHDPHVLLTFACFPSSANDLFLSFFFLFLRSLCVIVLKKGNVHSVDRCSSKSYTVMISKHKED